MQRIVRNSKKTIQNILDSIAPLMHFIPNTPRKKIAAYAYKLTSPKMGKPKPYIKGKFPYGINLYGLFKAEMGIAQGAKMSAASLEKGKIPHVLLNLSYDKKLLPQNDSSFDEQLSDKAIYAVNVIHINADVMPSVCTCFAQNNYDNHYNIGMWVWEFEKIPRNWLPAFDLVDEIWTPSEFSAKAFRKETEKPVTVIPHAISVPYDQALCRSDFGLPEEKFIVLTMFDSKSSSSRKNPAAAIKAFVNAFPKSNENAHLVIKVNRPSPEDIQYIHETLGDENRYTIIEKRLPKEQVNALIHLCDVLISLHRCEGFGLVMAEAMALGVPVVATNWSANVEFMPPHTACMVDYQLIPASNYLQFDVSSMHWADADVAQAADYLKRLYEDKDFYAMMAENGRRHIQTCFSPEAIAKIMKARLDEILK